MVDPAEKYLNEKRADYQARQQGPYFYIQQQSENARVGSALNSDSGMPWLDLELACHL